jgi:acylaminoacyl-peptidase
MKNRIAVQVLFLALVTTVLALAETRDEDAERKAQRRFKPIDVFALEFASEPQISPDGTQIVYVRNFMDIMEDTARSSLWSVRLDGSDHRPLTDGNGRQTQPRWSPDGKRLAYVAVDDDSSQLYVRWLDTGQTARITQLTRVPSSLSWSADGRWIAFSMLVPESTEPLARLPKKPKNAEWAEPAKIVRKLTYRYDGRGYLEDGFQQIFVVPSDGGTHRQLTFGSYHHAGKLAWTPDSQHLIFSANRHDDWEYNPNESDLFEMSIADGTLRQLTDRSGPDGQPDVSPSGDWIAYIGFDDQLMGFHTARLSVMRRDGTQRRVLTEGLDRSVQQATFSGDGRDVYFLFDDQGVTKIGSVTLDGQLKTIASHVGGQSLGRPYASGSYTASRSGRIAYTHSRSDHPADVAIAGTPGAPGRRITQLNADLFSHKELAQLEELWIESSYDRRRIQAWLLKPPGFSSDKKYPLILEIHGGPFANYGDRFSAEMQLYAAAGYVVLYVNPRGSTGYGHDFANLIHHNYPGEDYDDLMSAVDAVIKLDFVDPKQLFVTGGSGGGVLSSWIVGKTDRFRAAVVAKPVINWFSFALTSDAYNFFYKYWFPGYPWEHADEYLRRSPISLVGNVTTPTMLLTGEDDYRTPISETEQFYQALKLRKVDTILVRIPGASHSITARPSRLISKAAHVLAWFDRYREDQDVGQDGPDQ